jgi:polyhydroxyalkanoate synthesis repressor PhaR
MLNPTEKPAAKLEPVVVKKYANRRLYNTETSTYVTLDDLAAMVKAERDFVVFDAKSGDDLTHSVLTQIIVEQESNRGADTMLPVPFLRTLIRFYGDNIEKMVPSYLQASLDSLTKEQDRYRKQFSNVLTPAGAIEAYQEQARKNLLLFEQAMGMFSPFKPGTGMPGATGHATPQEAPASAQAPMSGPASHASPVTGKPVVVPTGPRSVPMPMTAPVASNAPSATKAADAVPMSAPVAAPVKNSDELAEMRQQMAAMQAMMEKLARDRT